LISRDIFINLRRTRARRCDKQSIDIEGRSRVYPPFLQTQFVRRHSQMLAAIDEI
jgi:hypothetical protein